MQDTTNNPCYGQPQTETYYSDLGLQHRNICHRPNILGFVAMDFPIIILCGIGWIVVWCFIDYLNQYALIPMIFWSFCLCLHCQYVTTMKYHVGVEQLMYQRGLFSLRRDYIEMYRVVDFDESRSLLEIILGIKTVTVYACDRTTPYLRIIGVPKDTDFIETIRERCIRSRKQNGIYEITNR